MSSRTPTAATEDVLAQAHRLLRAGDPWRCLHLLAAKVGPTPTDVNARWLKGAATLDQGRAEDALAIFDRVLECAPDFAAARVDRSRARRANGDLDGARSDARAVLEREPHHARAWYAYADALVDLAQYRDASTAYERARRCEPAHATMAAATAALLAGHRREAEEGFRGVLTADPAHVSALCGLAAISLAADRPRDAERLLRHALRQSAHVPLAYRGLGPALLALGRLTEAAAVAAFLRRVEPDHPHGWIATAAAAARLLRPEEALAAYREAARMQPEEVALHTSIGHLLKSLGEREDSERSYKAALALDPGCAEAWWSLADLKNYTFSDAEVAALQRQVDAQGATGDAQRYFALGKAYEQRGDVDASFRHYAAGNARRRHDNPFDWPAFEHRSRAIRDFFSHTFFAQRPAAPPVTPIPIFIVGMPRAGSTLLEQILASHSAVEGTAELPNILHLVRDIDQSRADGNGYPEELASLPPPGWDALGQRYLDETAPLRGDKPYFIDKLPNNFSHVGLIHAILPGARLIDARRQPMDCCFSLFKQHFAEGQTFAYDLGDLGRYYRHYLELMAHWDTVLPGRVLRVQYEELVDNPEGEIRRLLAYCGLPFEAGCLDFHRTRRAVRTPSAEQVRQPLNRSGIDAWRPFERYLGPLRSALGDALTGR